MTRGIAVLVAVMWATGLAGAQEPGAPGEAELLIGPPAGSVYQAAASAAESEGEEEDDGLWVTDGEYESEASHTYVFLTEGTLEDVVRHFSDAGMEGEHYVDMMDVFADYETEELNVEAQPAAPLTPEAMEQMIEQYRSSGVLTDEEAEEALSEMGLYRRLYPKLKDVVVRSVSFTIEEDREEGEAFRYVDVEIAHPYIDPAAMEVRDRTAVVYLVHRMVPRQD